MGKKVLYSTVRNLLLEHYLFSPSVFKKTKRRKQNELKELKQTKENFLNRKQNSSIKLKGRNPLKTHPTRLKKIFVTYCKWRLRNITGSKMKDMLTFTQY